MRKIHFLIFLSILVMQPAFADESMISDSKSCDAIAKACKNAGFAKNEKEHQKFWFD